MKLTNLAVVLVSITGIFVVHPTRAIANTAHEAPAARERKAKGEVEIFGAVVEPGSYILAKGKNISLEEALKRAGGITPSASKRISVKRCDEKGAVRVYAFNLGNSTDQAANFRVEAGDMLIVMEGLP